MALWDNIGKKASQTTAKAAQQVKILTETTKLNGMISDEEKKINNHYYQIGKLYATIHQNDPENELADLVAAVVESEKKIKEYRTQIQDMKGVVRCEKCGAEVAKGAAFCSACGAAVPKPVAPVQDNLEKCASCGAMVEKGMRFCTSCGKPMAAVTANEPVQETVVEVSAKATCGNSVAKAETPAPESFDTCGSCGALVEKGMRFCTTCGKPMEAVTAEVMEEATAIEESSKRVCANCGAMVEEDMRFCTTCGNAMESLAESPVEIIDVEPIVEIPAKRVCVNCGAELEDDALFCTECGTKV